MTLVEFIAPLGNSSHRERVLACMHFMHRYDSMESKTVETIRHGLQRARVRNRKRVNVADVLSKGGAYVDTPGSEGPRRLWRLTPTGEAHVRELLGLPVAEPEVEHDVGSLSKAAASLKDPEIKGYVEEAIKSLQVGALRACVVFLWVGSIRTLHVRMLGVGTARLNAALQNHDRKARQVMRLEDFAYVKDSIALLAARDLGLVDKGQKDTLEEALGLRNRCGHPGKYVAGAKKVSSLIEDLISILLR